MDKYFIIHFHYILALDDEEVEQQKNRAEKFLEYPLEEGGEIVY